MSVLEAVVLGIVQGITEFLPVSSSGHLQIAKEVLGVTLTDNLTFDIMLHLATVLATLVVLWREVTGLFKGVLQFKYNTQTAYVLKLLLSMVPVALVGFLMRDELNAMLSSPHILLIVGAMLLVTALLLVFANRAREFSDRAPAVPQSGTKDKAREITMSHGRQKTDISYRDAFIIGLGQAAAAMPGLSRSGTTIATGLLLGNKKAVVAQFSFLMVMLPILGEALLDLVRGDFSAGLGVGVLPLVGGFVAAFAVGCAACKFMIEMVKRSKLIWFAVYCGVVGLVTIIWYFV